MPMKTTTLPTPETQARIQQLKLVSFEKLMSTLRSFTAEDGAAVGVKMPQRA